MQLTGWDAKNMVRARLNALVKFKKDRGFWYLLESVNEKFLIALTIPL